MKRALAAGIVSMLAAVIPGGPAEAPPQPTRAAVAPATVGWPLEPTEDLSVLETPPPPPEPAPAPEPEPPPAPPTTIAPSPPPAPRPPAGGDDVAANRALGQRMAADVGWTGAEWDCLDELWGVHESGWRTTAANPSSAAYGIPQALPGSKMGEGWQYDAAVQIAWGLGYIGTRYETPCGADAAFHRQSWY